MVSFSVVVFFATYSPLFFVQQCGFRGLAYILISPIRIFLCFILSFFILLPCALGKCNVVSWHFRDKMANLLIIENLTYWLILKIVSVEPYSGHNWGSYELGQPSKCTCHQLFVSNQPDWVKAVLSCVRQSFNVVVLKKTFLLHQLAIRISLFDVLSSRQS